MHLISLKETTRKKYVNIRKTNPLLLEFRINKDNDLGARRF
jgi:hypothetical protein